MASIVIESEWDDSHDNSLVGELSNAKFCYKATMEKLEKAEQRSIDKNQLHCLVDGSFLKSLRTFKIKKYWYIQEF